MKNSSQNNFRNNANIIKRCVKEYMNLWTDDDKLLQIKVYAIVRKRTSICSLSNTYLFLTKG